jgi:hypothetical protein
LIPTTTGQSARESTTGIPSAWNSASLMARWGLDSTTTATPARASSRISSGTRGTRRSQGLLSSARMPILMLMLTSEDFYGLRPRGRPPEERNEIFDSSVFDRCYGVE